METCSQQQYKLERVTKVTTVIIPSGDDCTEANNKKTQIHNQYILNKFV